MMKGIWGHTSNQQITVGNRYFTHGKLAEALGGPYFNSGVDKHLFVL